MWSVDDVNKSIAKAKKEADKAAAELAKVEEKARKENEALKAQDAAFRASCKRQKAQWKGELAQLEAADTADTDDNRKLAEIEAMHAKVSSKFFPPRSSWATRSSSLRKASS